MNNRQLAIAALILSLTLSACGQEDEEAGPGGVSAGEAEALDAAAEIIEARRLPIDALPDEAANNGAPLPPAGPAQDTSEEPAE